jgi:hypothetical protein
LKTTSDAAAEEVVWTSLLALASNNPTIVSSCEGFATLAFEAAAQSKLLLPRFKKVAQAAPTDSFARPAMEQATSYSSGVT